MALKNKIYGFGIVDKEGAPWWDESCVCEYREPLDYICKDINNFGSCYEDDKHCIPYRVVRLYFTVVK